MSKFGTVKEVINTVVGKIMVVLMIILIMTSIVPELLNARNDFAVILGVGIIISVIALITIFYKKILKWLGFDIDKNQE